ncbi:hypothetical protein J6590_037722, partial [Homalodisca vitripennis]
DRGRSPARRQATTPTPQQVPASSPAAPGASNSGGSSGSVEDDDYAPPPLPVSRRPSLGDMEFGGPGGALALVLCGNPPRPPGLNSLPRGVTMGPGSTTTILRHECFLHQSAALVHHHQCRVHDLSGSEDDEPEPGYASGTTMRHCH